MDALSDEILMEILKRSYDHPYEILGSLSLVCKQWRRLYEEKYCWSKAELTLSDMEPLEILKKNATVLIKASQLHTLSIACKKLEREDDFQKVLLRSLQLRTEGNLKIKVLNLQLNDIDILQHLALFMTKNAMKTTEVLNIWIMSRHWTSFPQVGLNNNYQLILFLNIVLHSNTYNYSFMFVLKMWMSPFLK